jgi:hypothetical protein
MASNDAGLGGEVKDREEGRVSGADWWGGEHAWECGAEEAEDEASEETVSHEAGVVLSGVELEPTGVV